jgi:hypothetical protein
MFGALGSRPVGEPWSGVAVFGEASAASAEATPAEAAETAAAMPAVSLSKSRRDIAF